MRNVLAGSCLLLTMALGAIPDGRLEPARAAQGAARSKPASGIELPAFEVDPLWPKPLPNHWLFGSISGVVVDAQDRVWVVHRGADSLNARTEMSAATSPKTADECCVPAPAVLAFDASGALVTHWGGPGDGYDWPRATGGMAIDARGNIWIAGAGWPDPAPPARGGGATTSPPTPRPQDAHVLKFSRDGKFLHQIGQPGKVGGNDSKTNLNRPAAVDVDPSANELYVADGFGNRRIVVFDADTGAYKRHWGAYGKPPQDGDIGAYDPNAEPATQFRSVTCVKLSKDGLVYVCDRKNNRIQVFRKDGTFVKETVVSKATRGEGAVWDLTFSKDPQQRLLYVADGQDQKVFILERESLAVVSSLGGGGRWPGTFFGVGSVALDSKGNVYTGENLEGKRVQKFTFKGVRKP